MFYFYCKLYNTRATAVLSWTTFCPVFTDFSASFLTTSWKMSKKHPKKILIKKLFLVLLMIRSKLSLSKKLANSMILANDLCQPSGHLIKTFWSLIILFIYWKRRTSINWPLHGSVDWIFQFTEKRTFDQLTKVAKNFWLLKKNNFDLPI